MNERVVSPGSDALTVGPHQSKQRAETLGNKPLQQVNKVPQRQHVLVSIYLISILWLWASAGTIFFIFKNTDPTEMVIIKCCSEQTV